MNDANPLRVVVADDEPLVRQGLRMILELEPRIQIVAEAADGLGAVACVREHRPTWPFSTSGCRGSTASRPPGGSAPTRV